MSSGSFFFVASIYFKNPIQGEKLLQSIEAFIAWCRASNTRKKETNYWSSQEKVNNLNFRRQKAFAAGHKVTARAATSEIIQIEQSEMPENLKTVIPKRMRMK